MTTHRLVLLRHAKAERGLDVPDAQRPLTVHGRRQSAEVGTALAAAGLVPDLVLCSSSVRTRQTWELVEAACPGARLWVMATCIQPFSQRARCASQARMLTGASSSVVESRSATRQPARARRRPRSASSVTFQASQPITWRKAVVRK